MQNCFKYFKHSQFNAALLFLCSSNGARNKNPPPSKRISASSPKVSFLKAITSVFARYYCSAIDNGAADGHITMADQTIPTTALPPQKHRTITPSRLAQEPFTNTSKARAQHTHTATKPRESREWIIKPKLNAAGNQSLSSLITNRVCSGCASLRSVASARGPVQAVHRIRRIRRLFPWPNSFFRSHPWTRWMIALPR